MHPLIPSPAHLLGLPSPNHENTIELTETLISELHPTSEHPQTSLQALGCTAIHPTTTTNFLLTTLLAQRIHQHRTPPPNHESADRNLADAVSRLTVVLGKPSPPVHDPSSLSAYISSLLPHLPHPRALVADPLNGEQIRTLQAIQSRLHGEHETRVQLLLTRFNVTVSAFSRSSSASDHSFFYGRNTQQMARNAETVSLYQAIAATRHVLKPLKRTTSVAAVKNFVMGSVPDRGGRLDKPFMPSFKGRTPPVSEIKAGKNKLKGKQKGRGKRRQFEQL